MEELALGTIGIEIGLHQLVIHVVGPADEVLNGLLRTVGIEHLEAVTEAEQFVTHGTEAVGCWTSEVGHGADVAGDASAYEVEGGKITDVEQNVGAGFGEQNEICGNMTGDKQAVVGGAPVGQRVGWAEGWRCRTDGVRRWLGCGASCQQQEAEGEDRGLHCGWFMSGQR